MKNLFQDISELEFDDYTKVGYAPFLVSVFDHRLTEAEFVKKEFVCHSEALRNGNIEKYMIGEKKFISMYMDMAKDGVVTILNGKQIDLAYNSKALYSIITDSLREIVPMDVYFNRYEVRVVGGFDRTDLFLSVKNPPEKELYSCISLHGLYIL